MFLADTLDNNDPRKNLALEEYYLRNLDPANNSLLLSWDWNYGKSPLILVKQLSTSLLKISIDRFTSLQAPSLRRGVSIKTAPWRADADRNQKSGGQSTRINPQSFKYPNIFRLTVFSISACNNSSFNRGYLFLRTCLLNNVSKVRLSETSDPSFTSNSNLTRRGTLTLSNPISSVW